MPSQRLLSASKVIFAGSKNILSKVLQSSSKKVIYLIRHGQTDYNKRGIVQGSGVDTSLNETGLLQAEAFFQTYQYVHFDRIYTSALKRTQETVAPFLRIYSADKMEILPELNEINWGKMEGQLPTAASNEEFNSMLAIWRSGQLNTAVEGGETPLEMQERQKRGLEILMGKKDESNILLCMHGRAMRGFICLLTGTPLHQMDDFEHGNVCLYILEKFAHEPHFRLLLRNSRAHLHHLH